MDQKYHIEDVDRLHSPSLILFKEIVERNLVRMIEIAGSVDRLRPHCKTHKMAAIVEWQLELGITRHKCATIAEAEMLARCGVGDIFLAYNPVGPNIERVVELVRNYPLIELKVTADHPEPVNQLQRSLELRGLTVEVLLDVNPGMNRTGINPGPEAVELYQQIDQSENLIAGGLHVYDGHHRDADRDVRCEKVNALWKNVEAFRRSLEQGNCDVPRIVVGGTGSFPCYAEIDDPVIELSPGTVVFHDAGYQQAFPDMSFEPAALVLTRVISIPGPNLLTLDLGHKACAADAPAGGRLCFPDLPDKVEVQQNEEHLVVQTELANGYRPGDHLLAIPWHACPTSAAHQRAYVIEQGEWVDTWPVTARDRCLSV